MRGLFIPEITAEMFRTGCLESIEALMEEGEIYDIEYSRWIPVGKRLPEVGQRVIATIETIDGNYVRETIYDKHGFLYGKGIAWMPLPTPYQSEIPTGAEGSDKE